MEDKLSKHLLYERAIPKKIVLLVLERDLWSCRSCNARESIEIHHVQFRSRGGSHHPDNLITLCSSCHRKIHDGKLVVRNVEGNYFFGGTARGWRE